MPGRKPTVTANQIFEQLRHFEIFNGLNLKKMKDPVWIELCEALSVYGHIKPKNLYFILHQDRHNLMTLYKQYKSINKGCRALNVDNILNTKPDNGGEEEIELEDPKPSFIYNRGQLKKSKQVAVNEDLNIQKGANLFESLENLKKDVLYSKYIKEIGFSSFFLMYWSAEQISIHNDLQELTDNYVSIDTAGPISFRISQPDDNSRNVFLTVLVTNVENTIVPLSQVLSEDNDTKFLIYWLEHWLISGAKAPKRIVLNRSRALLNAVCLAFNNISYSDYNNSCLEILLGYQHQVKINTLINLDIAHLLHSAARWKCFHNVPSSVKEFYLRCIGFMSTKKSLKDFKCFLKTVSTVAQSKYYDHTCHTSLNVIGGAINTFKMPNSPRNDSMEEILQDVVLEGIDEASLMSRFIQWLITNSKPDRTEEDLENKFLIRNDFYLPGVIQPISKLCKEFPCWTNIMNSTFGNPQDVATSAPSQTYLGQLESTLLHDLTPLREDTLFAKHCKKIEHNINMIRPKIKNLYKLKEKQE